MSRLLIILRNLANTFVIFFYEYIFKDKLTWGNVFLHLQIPEKLKIFPSERSPIVMLKFSLSRKQKNREIDKYIQN